MIGFAVRGTAVPAILSTCLLSFAPLVHAHDGHDHGAPPPPPGVAAPRAETTVGGVQLVAARAQPQRLEIFLDRREDNAPLTHATATVETPSGSVMATETAPGLHRLAAPWLARPGDHDLIVVVTGPDGVEILPITLSVPSDAPAIAAPAIAPPDRPARTPDGLLFAPKSLQRLLEVRVATTTTVDAPRTMATIGRIIADPSASGVAASPVAGRVSPPQGGFPVLGARVKAGDPLAVVTPALQAIDRSDTVQRGGELDQQIQIVRRRLERLRRLGDVASRAQIEETELELHGLQERRRRLSHSEAERLVVTAPTDGVVATTTAIHGRIADPNAPLFLIVDPSRLWIEALLFAPPQIGAPATARLPDGRALRLSWRGVGRATAPQSQATPALYAIDSPPEDLALDQRATVFAPSAGAPLSGVAAPRSAVARGADGLDQLLVQISPERFQPRTVVIAPLDAERVLIVSGAAPGLSVVTQGAELLRRIR